MRFFDRQRADFREEKIYGGIGLKWLYTSFLGRFFLLFLIHPFISKIYGWFQSSFLSRYKITDFINKYEIDIEEYIVPGKFDSFNHFFIRQFKKESRRFIAENKIMPAFCEARYLGFSSVDADQTFPVKGEDLNPQALMGNSAWQKQFIEGPILIARLCPVDYHRFHFPDDGIILDHYCLPGKLDSVNPLALKTKGVVFSTNERQVTILQTENFGILAYIEVGALLVGKIKQTYQNKEFKRGDEKGYFLFGASTVIVLGQKNLWLPSEDILSHTKEKIETLVLLGEPVAKTLS